MLLFQNLFNFFLKKKTICISCVKIEAQVIMVIFSWSAKKKGKGEMG
jgi:hypothetical protein